MEAYCLRVSHPQYEGWWVTTQEHYTGSKGVLVDWGYFLAPDAAGISSWVEPKLTEIQEDLQSGGYDTIRIILESAKQYMSS
jgi:hypothetical protein